jgi:hypothetical protein
MNADSMTWPTEKRREPRYSVKTPVWVEACNGRRMMAATRDISDHGLGLWIAGSGVAGGEAVMVRFQDETVAALVRHAETSGSHDESWLGLELEHGITDRQARALLTLGSLG